MAAINTARDRAEEWLHNLHKRGRNLIDAEEGMLGTARELVEKQGLAPSDVRRRLDGLVGRFKTNKVWERVRDSNTVVALNNYRGGLEKRTEERVHRLLGALHIATTNDVDHLNKQVRSMTKKIGDLSKKLKDN